MTKKHILLILLMLVNLITYAQTERLYTVNTGLPNSLITALAQDSIGNLWVGTENGLCKYDGAKFISYRHNAKDSTSLLSDRISTLFVTDKGKILVGTQMGLQIYNPDYDRFEKVRLTYLNTDTIPIHVSSIKLLNDGNIILGSLGTGIFKLDTDKWHGHSVVEKNRLGIFTNGLSVSPDNDIWLGTAREGALKGTWDAQGILKMTPIPSTNDWIINEIATDRDGNVYYSTQYGIYKVSDKNHTPQLILETPKEKVQSMAFKDDNTLLLGLEGRGIIAYDIKKDELTDAGFNTGRTDISKSKVRAMLIDRNDNLWLGLYQRGVLACQSQSNQFDYIGTGSASKDIIGTNPVIALYQSDDGTLWVAADNDGVYAIGNSGTRHYPQGANNMSSLITNIFKSSDGKVWIESFGSGLAILDPATGVCKPVDAFNGKRVFDIIEDDQHRLWIATMGEGLFRTDLNGNIQYKAPFTDQRHYTTGSDLLHNSWINSLTLSNDGKKLFINTCYGVGCYDMEAESFVNVFGENRILAGEMCYDSYQDVDGYLWVATTNGVYRWHIDDDEIAHFDTDNGLCNNTVVGITADKKGDIWLATYCGLSKYDKSTGKFTNYYAHDGIQGNEFSLRSLYRNDDGVIYAGGLNGITVYNGEEQPTRAPKIRIADVYLHDQAINHGTESNGKPIIREHDGKRVYDFDINDNSIGVELTTDQFNNNYIRYQYSIDSGEWTSLQPGANKVYLSSLKPGNHTIAFKAISFDTESDIEHLNIHVRQHWYLTWWAILLYCIIIGLIGYVVYRVIKNKRTMEAKIEEQAKKDEFNNTTMQFLVNVAHEIRTPISLITNPIDQLSEIHTDGDSKHLFAIIRSNLNRMLLLANQLIDVRKIDHNQLKLNRVPTEMCEYVRNTMSLFSDMAERKQIELRVDAETSPLYADIDRHQFDKVIVNLLSNAFKFTAQNGHITVKLSQHDNVVEITVTDDGIGIPQEHIPHIFERFYQSDENTKRTNLGSGVGLHLTSLIVSKHDGKISAVNNPDGAGASFVIELPSSTADESQIHKAAATTDHEMSELISRHIDTESDYELVSKDMSSKPTLVIVEDNADIKNYLHEQLQQHYNIKTYDNGKQALAAIIANKPDLLITDIMLPGIDGYTLIKNIRQNININDLPIIVLTNKGEEPDIITGIESGADLYLIKPFNIRLLKSYIESLLNQRHRLKIIYKGYQIDDDIANDTPEIKTPDSQLLERLAKAINANIANPDYTVVDLASDVCMSRVHLNRKLKQLTNQSPSTYLRNIRLAKAAEMLRDNPGISVSDVAKAVGMTSFSHFSHAFKALYGCSPSEYAERGHENM